MDEFPSYAEYTFSIFDESLESLARRCNSSVDEIYMLSQRMPGLRLVKSDFVKAVKPGVAIRIPLDPTERWWRWPVFPIADKTQLAAFVAEKNRDPRRFGLEPLTAKYLWFHPLNGTFRDHHLRAHMLQKDALEKTPEILAVKGVSPPLRVPYPFKVEAGWVNGAPQGTRHGPLPPPPAPTVALPPPDLVSLMFFRNRIESLAKKLRVMNTHVFDTFQKNGIACYRLDVTDLVCSLVVKFPKELAMCTEEPWVLKAREQVQGLQKKLDALRKVAAEVMLKNPMDVINPSHEKEREELGKQLLRELRASHIVENIKASLPELLKDKNKVLLDTLCNVVEEACIQLTQSPVAEDALHDIEEAVAFVAGMHPVDVDKLATIDEQLAAEVKKLPATSEPKTVLGALLSAIAPPLSTITGVTLSLVGNLPGPPSLAVGLVTIAGLASMPKVAETLTNVSTARGFAARYVAAALRTFNATEPPKSATAAHAEWVKHRDLLVEAMFDAKKHKDAVNMLVRRTSDGFQGSPKWMKGMTAIAVIAFIVACVSDDENKPRKIANIVGSGASAASGILASFARFRAFAPQLAKGLGYIGAICTCISGILSAREAYAANDLRGGHAAVVSATGGAMILIGSVMVEVGGLTAWTGVGAGVAAVGLVLVIGATVYETLRDVMTVGTQKVFYAMVSEFGKEADEYLSKRPDLKKELATVQEAMYDATFVWHVHPSQRDQLAKAGFGKEELDMLHGL